MRTSAVLVVFTLTLFLSAFLLFCVQPMIARMILPLLGGSPTVWSTCMVFFQAMLLAGYAYAHLATSKLGVGRQAIVHAILVLLPALALPFGIPADATRSLSAEGNPTWWLLGLLIVVVGLPFFVVSTSAPLLQRWFSQTGHPAADDPYFLYGASNLGSMLALLAYPVVIEPNLGLTRQRTVWAAGYGVLAALTLACAFCAWLGHVEVAGASVSSPPTPSPGRLRPGQVLRWIALAFIPSSLMLGITTYLTTDIAAIPLLWVIPLALYLLTFILTFARRPLFPRAWVVRAFPMTATLLAILMGLFSQTQTQMIFIPLHLACFFLAAMLCHGELVQRRPASADLTAFYLAMSFGGVLGGIFNALVAPGVFDRVAEYPLALVLACLVLPGMRSDSRSAWPRLLDWLMPAALGALAWGLITLLSRRPLLRDDLAVKLAIGAAVFACFTFKDRPVRFALGLGAVLMASGTYTGYLGQVLYQHRNYFGVVRVAHDSSANDHRLIHGHTLHGAQSLQADRRREPLTYYVRTGPIGQVFGMLHERNARASIAIVGLGAGSLACYAEPGQNWDFYEIDPVVVKIARDRRYFTFLDESRAGSTDVVLGDARLRLRDAPEHGYTLIVLDAFSSDAIPTHLLTREAVRLYLSKLAEGGIIAFHISNHYVDLGPVVGTLARDAGRTCLVRSDLEISPEESRLGKCSSIWAVVASRDADLEALRKDARWKPPAQSPAAAVWTDDFSNLVEYLIVKSG